MIIVLKPEATENDAIEIQQLITNKGLKPLYLPGVERTVIGAIGDERKLNELHLDSHPAIETVTPILSPYKLVSREFKHEGSIVKIGNATIGGSSFLMIAGPCAVENREQILSTAASVKKSGAHVIRGGAYKPRSSPYSFQGLEEEGLKLLKEASLATELPFVTEVVEVTDITTVCKYADAIQVGARNMQNFRLLRALGQQQLPIILKRGMAATVEDLLLAAEYIVAEGNTNVILCERGIRTFETSTRNTLDLSAIPHIKKKSHLPVIVDPSHGTGVRDYVIPMSKAAVAAGADGIIVEVHCDPKNALSDGAQSLTPSLFDQLVKELLPFIKASGKE